MSLDKTSFAAFKVGQYKKVLWFNEIPKKCAWNYQNTKYTDAVSKVSGDKNRKLIRRIQLKQTSNYKNFLEIVILMFHEDVFLIKCCCRCHK